MLDSLLALGMTPEAAQHHVERWRLSYERMRPWLPLRVLEFLDIGCGYGGIAVQIARHYPGAGARANLLDGLGMRPKWGGYQPLGAPWMDVAVAGRLYEQHCPGRRFVVYGPDEDETMPCDFIYSICSWCHHYPVETYLGLVRRSLVSGGALIVDLRLGDVGDHGRRVLAGYFDFVADIWMGRKYVRTAWKAR